MLTADWPQPAQEFSDRYQQLIARRDKLEVEHKTHLDRAGRAREQSTRLRATLAANKKQGVVDAVRM